MNEKYCRRWIPIRSGGLCERCGKQAHSLHHRKNRSAGGGWALSNIVHLCGDGVQGCHGWATDHPADASADGYHVKPWENPADVPIKLWSGWSRLTDEPQSHTEYVDTRDGWSPN